MKSEKNSSRAKQMICPTIEARHKLNALGGGETVPLKVRIHEVRKKLGWWDTTASGRIKRLLYGEQKPYAYLDEIRRAFAKHCLHQIEANREQNRKLAEQFAETIRYFETHDPSFYREQIEEMRGALARLERGAPSVGPHS